MRILGSTMTDNSQEIHDRITFYVYALCQSAGYKGKDLRGHYASTDTQFTYRCCVDDDVLTGDYQDFPPAFWYNTKSEGSCNVDDGDNF